MFTRRAALIALGGTALSMSLAPAFAKSGSASQASEPTTKKPTILRRSVPDVSYKRPKRVVYRGDGFSYYMQYVDPTRYDRSFSYGGQTLERFELRAGDDHWNGYKGSDYQNYRERCEARATTEDPVGSKVAYSYGLLIPPDYRHMSPKQTLGQWHNGKWDNCFLRLENGRLAFAINVHKPSVFKTFPIRYQEGKLLNLRFEFDWQKGTNGHAVVYADNVKVVDYHGVLLDSQVKSLYFKYGIYRSSMNLWRGRGAAPTLVAYFRSPKRQLL